MAEINPIGIDQTTGQERSIAAGDDLNVGNQISLAITNVGDYSGGSNNVQSAYSWDNPTRLDDPTTLPAGLGRGGVEFSPNGEFLAVGHIDFPYITIYQRTGSTFNKLPDPATLPTSGLTHEALAWSPNGEFLVVGHGTSPGLTIYQRDGSTFTKIADPAVLPSGGKDCIHFSYNGEYMTVGHTSSPFITTYHVDGTTFTKLSDPSSLPANTVQGVRWSPDGKYLAVAVGNTAPYFTWYEKTGIGSSATLTLLSDPNTQPTSTGFSVDWHPSGNYVTYGSLGLPRFVTFELSGGSLSAIAEPASMPTATVENLRYSRDGNYLATTNLSTPFLNVYAVSDGGATMVRLDDPASLPAGGRNVGWSPDNQYLAIDGDDSPTLSIYQTGVEQPSSGILKINGIRRAGT